MKKINLLLIISFVLCSLNLSFAKDNSAVTGEDVLKLLMENNKVYEKSAHNFADITPKRRQETANNGQKPYAIIVTCSDSRVPPEHIFQAGIGDLFVIRNAGNIISTNELGSIEYAVKHLGVKLVLVLGHTKCGAVSAALKCDCAEENVSQLQNVVHKIHKAVKNENNPRTAERLNVEHSLKNIQNYKLLNQYLKENKILLKGGLYNINTGSVEFF